MTRLSAAGAVNVLVLAAAVACLAALQVVHGRDLTPTLIEMVRNDTGGAIVANDERCDYSYKIKSSGSGWLKKTVKVHFDYLARDTTRLSFWHDLYPGGESKVNLVLPACMSKPCFIAIKYETDSSLWDWFCNTVEFSRFSDVTDDYIYTKTFNVNKWVRKNEQIYINDC